MLPVAQGEKAFEAVVPFLEVLLYTILTSLPEIGVTPPESEIFPQCKADSCSGNIPSLDTLQPRGALRHAESLAQIAAVTFGKHLTTYWGG